MKPRILAVDDDERNLALLTAKLEREGYELDTARNGVEALQKVAVFLPDLIIMDVMMPQMDGYEALRHLKSREETRYIPVIMLTGRAEIEDKVLGFEVGAEDYINKPYSLQEVAARVKSLLRMRSLQTKLRETEKVAALGEMVDGIAHEIRNPLTAIGGMARRLYEGEADPQHKEYAQWIIRSVERLERMLQRIDEYKRILVSTLSKGDINMAVEAAVKDVKDFIDGHGKQISVKMSLMPEPPPVNYDYGNMKTALLNILQNSVEAIMGEGAITVETLPMADETIAIRVTDTGIGMEKEEIRKIFNPFQSTKFEGAGLGLTITYRIIQDHGGEIEVESTKGSGTAVTVRLHPAKQ
ncbi:two-component system, NtrC family, sensor histidine kinase HydH [uncultured bacterium]|nr:two-component system, NtrC family, sensor histidine kinase HydH [uncultured bacterium]